MPSAHRRYAEWTPDRFRRWAGMIGPNTEGLIARRARQPAASRTGFSHLPWRAAAVRGVDPARAEAVSARALEIGALTYKSIASIIAHKLDSSSPRRTAADDALRSRQSTRPRLLPLKG